MKASSKSALHGLIHWLAGNLAKKGITVNGVAPAVISGTAMMVSADDPEKEKMIAQSTFAVAVIPWAYSIDTREQEYQWDDLVCQRRLRTRLCGWSRPAT